MKNSKKYVKQYFEPKGVTMDWVKKSYVDKPPVWCSVDLRDGNQALIIPMSLEEKLELLGLNYKEAEEFIVYWLPKLESNKYNYIRFASAEEIERNMPLEVSGSPDSIIRIMMTYKGLNRPIEVKEQEIIRPERNGFVVVEWGGTEIR